MTALPARLETPRLTIRPVAPVDAAPIFDSWAQDREVTRYLIWRPHTTITETAAFIAAAGLSTSTRTYVLVTRDDGKVRGALDLRDQSHGRLDFGYVLARRWWGQGLMTEALTACADWALAQPDIWRIGAVCDTENLASARVMEKAGLVREGLLRRWLVHPNIGPQPRDCFVYAKVR